MPRQPSLHSRTLPSATAQSSPHKPQFRPPWNHGYGISPAELLLVANTFDRRSQIHSQLPYLQHHQITQTTSSRPVTTLTHARRPWSHVAIDFITDLPSSQGNTTILTIVDRFSKACHLIPLPKLPTSLETAELLCKQVFRYYGLPDDIVSDRGPQFTSRVWSAFFKSLNVNISLTSGYHPQSNGQTERLNQEVIHFLCSYCQQQQTEWSRYLMWAEYA